MSTIVKNTTHLYNELYDLKTYIDFSKLDDDTYLTEKHIKKCKKSDSEFILRYEKEFLNQENICTLGLFRSVIIHDGKVVGFAPPKSISVLDNCFTKYSDEVRYEEYVEGTMINLYYHNEDWKIATRSNIGANNKFFRDSPTFNKLFHEIADEGVLPFDKLNKKYSYSFVIQHPKNRIVSNPKKRLVLCDIFRCNQDFTVEHIPVLNDWYRNPELYHFIDIPRVYNVRSFDEAIMKFANPSHTTDFNIMGFVMRLGNRRAKYRNPEYEFARLLRGNHPKIQFQYFNLRKTGKVKQFLKYYPEYSDAFSIYRKEIHYFTQTLHKYYIDCFIYKTQTLDKYSHEYKPHLYKLHNDYLNILRPNGEKMSYGYVISYVNNLEPERLMFAVNYKHHRIISGINETSKTENKDLNESTDETTTKE